VVKDGNSISETDLFINKYVEDYKDDVLLLVRVIDYIGENGASRYLFRFEDEAGALPRYNKKLCSELQSDFATFPLRLYCLRLSDELVIFFNGGIKDKRTAQESKCSMQFYEAKGFTKKIDKAIKDRYISIQSLINLTRED